MGQHLVTHDPWTHSLLWFRSVIDRWLCRLWACIAVAVVCVCVCLMLRATDSVEMSSSEVKALMASTAAAADVSGEESSGSSTYGTVQDSIVMCAVPSDSCSDAEFVADDPARRLVSSVSTNDTHAHSTTWVILLQTNYHAITIMSVWTDVHCDHTVHFSPELSLWFDSPMFWAPWHQSMSTYSQPSFSSSTWDSGGIYTDVQTRQSIVYTNTGT